MADAIHELLTYMGEELRKQRDLADVLENKLDAMRHYDMSRLEALSAKEQALVEMIQQANGKRDMILQKVSHEVFPQQSERRWSARELAEAVSEPMRGKLLAMADVLKSTVEKVQKLNRVNSLATEKVMNHFNHIFSLLAQSGRDIGLYSQAGKKSLLDQNRLVDAIA